MPLSGADARFLERALALAEKGRGRTSPNPMVGAVITRGGEIIGEGHHVAPGQPHAEIAAIDNALRRTGMPQYRGEGRNAIDDARTVLDGATMYVTLEPCCTYGRTPPCTEALIACGFTRVVVAAIDPSPAVNGKGLELLRAAGIDVDVAEGDLAHRARRQNDGTRKMLTKGLPFVTYKYAMTLDGRTATDSGDSRWISSAESRVLVHQWRADSDAVVVGAGTLVADDPRLTARDVECERQPLRVVVDRALSLKRESALVKTLADGPVLAVCGPEVSESRRAEVQSWGVETAVATAVSDGGLDPLEVGRYLASRDVQTVLLEGGPRLAGAWWSAGLIDRVAAFICPVVVPGVENRGPLRGIGPARLADSVRLQELELLRVGSDILVMGYKEGPF